jgi:mono/diheme cytochrome c family protein
VIVDRGLRLVGAVTILLASATGRIDAAGADVFQQRCAACHLPDGAGVPSAYPRLAGRMDGLVTEEQGRRYVVMVVSKGLMGSLDVDGGTVQGVMAPQAGLSDDQVAQLLNDLRSLGTAKPMSRAFDAAEVGKIRSENAALDMQGVRALRPRAAGDAKP